MMNIMNPPADWSTMKKLIWLRGTPISGGEELTVSGTPPLSLPNSLGKPLKAWSVDVLPYQEGTGDPSPDNVRAIHGTDKLTITTSGANLLPTYTSGLVRDGLTYTVGTDGSVTVNGTATQTTTFYASNSTWQWDGVSDAWLSGCPAGGNYMNGYSLRVDPTYSEYSTPDTGNGVRLSGYSSQYNLANVPLRFCIVVRANTVCDNLVFRPMLNNGLSALPYTPYLAPSQTVLTLPQTVYTGTIGSDGGESRQKKIVLDGSPDENIALGGYGMSFRFLLPNDAKLTESNTDLSNDICNQMVQVKQATTWGVNGTFSRVKDGYTVWFKIDDTITTLEDLRTYLASNPIEYVYELATPQTFPLTSPTIPTPTGTATTWATAEDGTVDGMEVTYVGKA